MTALLLLLGAVTAFVATTVVRNQVYATGISAWKSMVDSSPDKRRPHENYGQALSTAGRLEEALTEFKTVLALPDDGSVPLRDVHREIGVVYFRLGRYEDSIQSWKTGLVYAPMDAGLLNNISIALLKLQRYDEAISHARMAVSTNETMPEPVNSLGEIYLAKGEFSRAAEQFKRYVYLRPEDPRGSWNLAIALTQAGQYEEASKYVARFLSQEPNPRERASIQPLVDIIDRALKNKR